MIGGLIGYLFKEYRDRLRPMISITRIGQLKKNKDIVEIPQEAVDAVNKSFSIITLGKTENLDRIFRAWDTANDVTVVADRFLELLDKLIHAASNKDRGAFSDALARCLDSKEIERWIRILLLDELVVPKPVDKNLPVQIPVFPSGDEDGCVILGLSKTGTSFGMHFNKQPLAKDKCMRFIDIVERLDYDALREFFSDVKQKMVNEKMLAKDAEPILMRLDHENSRWEFQLFIANLGNTPFLINPKGTVHIRDANGASYTEDCYLVLLQFDEKGNMDRTDTVTPLIVRGESDVEISFITTKTQQQMDHGNAIRVDFTDEKAKAKAQIRFVIEKSGLQRFVNLASPWVDFKETK